MNQISHFHIESSKVHKEGDITTWI